MSDDSQEEYETDWYAPPNLRFAYYLVCTVSGTIAVLLLAALLIVWSTNPKFRTPKFFAFWPKLVGNAIWILFMAVHQAENLYRFETIGPDAPIAQARFCDAMVAALMISIPMITFGTVYSAFVPLQILLAKREQAGRRSSHKSSGIDTRPAWLCVGASLCVGLAQLMITFRTGSNGPFRGLYCGLKSFQHTDGIILLFPSLLIALIVCIVFRRRVTRILKEKAWGSALGSVIERRKSAEQQELVVTSLARKLEQSNALIMIGLVVFWGPCMASMALHLFESKGVFILPPIPIKVDFVIMCLPVLGCSVWDVGVVFWFAVESGVLRRKVKSARRRAQTTRRKRPASIEQTTTHVSSVEVAQASVA